MHCPIPALLRCRIAAGEPARFPGAGSRTVLTILLPFFLLPVTAAIPASAQPLNDTCAGAVSLVRGGQGTYQGPLAGAANNYDPGPSGCTGHAAAGPDVVYSAFLEAGDQIEVTLIGDGGADASLYIITDCALPAASCVAGSDEGPNQESIWWTCSVTGLYYIICDTRLAAPAGSYYFTYDITCPTLPSACCCVDMETYEVHCWVTAEAECEALYCTWKGPWAVTCDPAPCWQPLGACCLADGTCAMLLQHDCELASGFFIDGDCPLTWCSDPVAACCFADDGHCELLLEEACEREGGVWLSDLLACEPGICSPAWGACCTSTDCFVGSEAECAASGGAWYPYTSCDQCQMGTCCLPGDVCAVMTPPECADGDGWWRGAAMDCDPNPCIGPQYAGACCLAGGLCSMLIESDCAAAGGWWKGPYVNCTAGACPQPGAYCACCLDGICVVLPTAVCLQEGGQCDGVCCQSPSSVIESEAEAAGTRLAMPAPNPFRGLTQLQFVVGSPGLTDLDIFTPDGRRVRTLVQEFREAGSSSCTWDGRDEQGQDLPSGVYLLVLRGADRTVTGSVVLLR